MACSFQCRAVKGRHSTVLSEGGAITLIDKTKTMIQKSLGRTGLEATQLGYGSMESARSESVGCQLARAREVG
jgi:hypothetical protein